MSKPHVRLSEGQEVVYTRFPDRVCIVHKIFDAQTPVHYTVKIPINSFYTQLENLENPQAYLFAQGISPHDLRPVDTIQL